jgi:hypothetical protein
MGTSNKAFVAFVFVLLVGGVVLGLRNPSVGILVGVIGVGFIVGRILTAHARGTSTHLRKLPDANDPRWLPPSGRPQVVGRECAACGRKITLSIEGSTCDACAVACHTKCLDEHRLHEHRPKSEEIYR